MEDTKSSFEGAHDVSHAIRVIPPRRRSLTIQLLLGETPIAVLEHAVREAQRDRSFLCIQESSEIASQQERTEQVLGQLRLDDISSKDPRILSMFVEEKRDVAQISHSVARSLLERR